MQAEMEKKERTRRSAELADIEKTRRSNELQETLAELTAETNVDVLEKWRFADVQQQRQLTELEEERRLAEAEKERCSAKLEVRRRLHEQKEKSRVVRHNEELAVAPPRPRAPTALIRSSHTFRESIAERGTRTTAFVVSSTPFDFGSASTTVEPVYVLIPHSVSMTDVRVLAQLHEMLKKLRHSDDTAQPVVVVISLAAPPITDVQVPYARRPRGYCSASTGAASVGASATSAARQRTTGRATRRSWSANGRPCDYDMEVTKMTARGRRVERRPPPSATRTTSATGSSTRRASPCPSPTTRPARSSTPSGGRSTVKYAGSPYRAFH